MEKNSSLQIAFILLRLTGTTNKNDGLFLKILVKVCHSIAVLNTTALLILAVINFNYNEGAVILSSSVEIIMSYYMVIA